MNKPIVSIVIPVYKVGKYIENSMKSVIAQSYIDIEIILVDNNTPDDSIEIAERVLAGTNIQYKVVKQTIQGLPAARNMGISEAKGEWIISIDPDDTISPLFISELYKTATENNLDVVFSEYDEVGEANLFAFPEQNLDNRFEILERDDVMHRLLTRNLPLMISNMFFRRNWFVKNNFQFDQDVILGADLILLWKLILSVDKIGHLNKKLYNHFCRPDSLMTAPSIEKIDSNLSGYNRLCNYISQNYSLEFSKWLYAREVFALLNTVCMYGNYKFLKKIIKRYYNKEQYEILKSFPDKRVILMNFILYHSQFVYFVIMKCLHRK